MKKRILNTIICLLGCVFLLSQAHALQSGNQVVQTQFDSKTVKAFSKKVEQKLAESRAVVAIVSRVGRPEKEMIEGLNYTHIGFAVYSKIQDKTNSSSKGYVMYNLYQSPENVNRSVLVNDFPFDFFSTAYKLKTGIIIPKPELQKRLLKLIQSPIYKNLHNDRYSAIANPYNNRFQNCTEFILNITTAALYQVDNMNVIKSITKQYFTEPYQVPINGLAVTFGSIFNKEYSIRDHDSGYFKTTTFGSIEQYFRTYDLAQEILQVNL